MAVTTAILKGELFLRKVGSTDLLSTGNATKITMTTEIEEKTIPNTQNPGGGNHDSFKRAKSCKLSISFRNLLKTTAEIAFGAKITAVAGGPIVDEAHADIVLGSLIPTVKRQDMTVALTAMKGVTPLVEGVDYRRKRAGIIPLAGGALIAADDITLSYTSLAVSRIDGLMNTTTEFFGLFDGVNERKSSPAYGEYYRLAFGPASNVELVGDEFVSLDVEAECLSDDTKPATDSPFYHFEIGGIE
ncbi:MAG: hypothetical protein HYU74_12665 [Dechloromonas sp.]|nr:hypothetical protein [Dechloromonas sp.]